MIAIFNIEQDSVNFSQNVHNFLTENRSNYNAVKWSSINQGSESEWAVKVPSDYNSLNESFDLGDSPKTKELPEIGGGVLIDEYYLYKGNIIKCRQTHNRTIYEPKDTPALFSFFRDNSDQLQWIENEQVEMGWVRIYNDIKYEVIQAHQTQSDWTPDIAVTLWKVYSEEPETPEILEWIQPTGAHDAYNIGDQVLFEGSTYESLINANVWSPSIYPAGWELI